MATLLGTKPLAPPKPQTALGAPTSSPTSASAPAALFNSSMNPQDVFNTAVANLGLTPQGVRATGTDAIADYINKNGWTGWQGGGTKAADWISLSDSKGSGWNWAWDVLPAGDKNFQWTDDLDGFQNPTKPGQPGTGPGGGALPGTGPPAGTPPATGPGVTPPPGTDPHGPLYYALHPGVTPPSAPPPTSAGTAPAMNFYSEAYNAALRARRTATGTGRSSTVLAGTAGSVTPATAPATLMGGR